MLYNLFSIAVILAGLAKAGLRSGNLMLYGLEIYPS